MLENLMTGRGEILQWRNPRKICNYFFFSENESWFTIKKIEPTDQRMRHKDLKLLNKYLITYTPCIAYLI